MKRHILRRLIKSRKISPAESQYSGNYGSFEEAIRSEHVNGYHVGSGVADHYIRGYRELSEIATNHQSNITMFRRVVPIMAALALCGDVRRVVDYGGSYGEYYHRLRWLNPNFDPIWDIVETDAVCRIGSELGANERKRFVPTIEALEPGSVDLVIVSGTLQYVAEPMNAIEAIFGIGSSKVIFSRLPVSERLTQHRVVIQRSPIIPAAFPMWFFAPSIFDEFGRFGRVLFDFTTPEDGVDLDGHSFAMCGCVVANSVMNPQS